jgi:hypothetical protein
VTAGREPGALAWDNGRMLAKIDASTLVSFPDGGLTGTSPVLAAVPLEGGYGVIVAQTPFHPLDHTWPDSPPTPGPCRPAGRPGRWPTA